MKVLKTLKENLVMCIMIAVVVAEICAIPASMMWARKRAERDYNRAVSSGYHFVKADQEVAQNYEGQNVRDGYLDMNFNQKLNRYLYRYRVGKSYNFVPVRFVNSEEFGWDEKEDLLLIPEDMI